MESRQAAYLQVRPFVLYRSGVKACSCFLELIDPTAGETREQAGEMTDTAVRGNRCRVIIHTFVCESRKRAPEKARKEAELMTRAVSEPRANWI